MRVLSIPTIVLCAALPFLSGCDESGTPWADVPYDHGGDPRSDFYTDTPADTPPPDTTTETTPDPTGSAAVGDPCYADVDCGGVPGSGRTCLDDIAGYATFPGGYCSATCTSGSECGPEGICVSLYGFGNYCLRRCSSLTDCRWFEGYTCSVLGSGSPTVCIPPLPGPDGGPIDI